MKIYFFAIATLLFMPNLLLGFIRGSFSEKFSAVDIYGLAVVAIAFFIFFYYAKTYNHFNYLFWTCISSSKRNIFLSLRLSTFQIRQTSWKPYPRITFFFQWFLTEITQLEANKINPENNPL